MPPEFYQGIMRIVGEETFLRKRAFLQPMTSVPLAFPYLDATSVQVAGVSPFFGGVQMTWIEEAQTRTESEPNFKMMELKVHELAGYTVSSNVLLQDTTGGLERFLLTLFGRAVGWFEEYAFLQGNGVGKPLGMLNAPATISVTRGTANAVKFADVAAMLARLLPSSQKRALWVVHPYVLTQLVQLADGSGRIVWVPNNGGLQRDYVRQRANLVRLSGQHIQRMQKALELMNLKLTTVLGDVTGATGLKIPRAILAGERDPQVLARLRDKRCKHTAAQIATALDGRYRPEHLCELRLSLTLWEQYQHVIAELDQEIGKHLRGMAKGTALPPLPPKPRVRGRKPHDPRFDVRTALYYATGVDLTAIEGIDEVNALTLISELGSDFTKWPTVKHFTSWLGLCPNFKKTGGKVPSSKTRRGKGRAAHALRLAAWSLMRSHSALGAYLRRQRSRLGAPKAITAHKLARIVYNLVRHGLAYVKQTEEAYAEQVRQRLEKQLRRWAKELGFELRKAEVEPAPQPA